MPPTSIAPGKTLHQRNKSTPALSSASNSNGGVKLSGANDAAAAQPKRAAFQDRSNVCNINKPTKLAAKDDLVISGKGVQVEVLEKPVVPAQEMAKPAVRPTQRPTSTMATKGPLNASTATSNNVAPTTSTTGFQKPTSSDKVGPLERIAQNAAARKHITKKATTVFRDTSASKTEELECAKAEDPHRDSVHNSAATTVGSQQPVQHGDITESRAKASELEVVVASNAAGVTGPSQVPAMSSVTDNASLENLQDNIAATLSQIHAVEKGEQQRKYPEVPIPGVVSASEPYRPVEIVEPPLLPASDHSYLITLERQARALEKERNDELARQQASIAPIPEIEEYWDEEEDEEYYDADGYTTARSLRSRGDNTTGGVTVVLLPRVTKKVENELAAAKLFVENTRSPDDIEDEAWDTSMVAEYGEEIFEYMKRLEDKMKPNPYYMDNQNEIQWSMRSVLMDWLVQVHGRFGLLPETLFLSVNYVDRFLSCKVVSLAKLQLVGATAIFVAAKYEEINCPSVQEIAYMVDHSYTTEEILKAERFMLSMLQFELGWPGPMSFLRRISKADDYDLDTRTLAKYFLEVTVMDERFVACTPSFTAAGAHCLARLMLRKGDWSPAHVYYSQYTYGQLRQLLAVILECCENPQKHHAAVYDKYVDKRYKRASEFVQVEMEKGFALPSFGRDSSVGLTHPYGGALARRK
ncbi:cyclin-like protein [Lineolata rhizophorae]|uniref:Cyclin-like protein n=1 Tax=Lineolata rhizophorae TaxID=578093 RepID=A0A6A6PDU5_9PEZI|nr:cyclin-like protein [Lineolata rhizophorae]